MNALRTAADLIRRHAKFVRFVVSGGGCAFLFFCLYYAGVSLGVRPFAANLIAYALAFSAGYLLQRSWTFGGRHRHQSALPRYAIVQVCCALLTSGVTEIATPHLQIPKLALSLVATIIAGGASYVASLLWVFPDGDAEHPV
ncbi:GtrA family protein [Phenylobacterium sp.]|uniref:GtrA family protein n=1 Tax=Phenylobacterium sp. TaxID=1871053 RepID=UPI00120E5F17|nr:GtrA family protein [Phenylobacterium sp.]THD63288.1 MAG: GtrA family protein [Phenylobacterium sp.]